MPKKLDRSNRIYLSVLDREATGARSGDILQVTVRLIKKGDDLPPGQAPRSKVPA